MFYRCVLEKLLFCRKKRKKCLWLVIPVFDDDGICADVSKLWFCHADWLTSFPGHLSFPVFEGDGKLAGVSKLGFRHVLWLASFPGDMSTSFSDEPSTLDPSAAFCPLALFCGYTWTEYVPSQVESVWFSRTLWDFFVVCEFVFFDVSEEL